MKNFRLHPLFIVLCIFSVVSGNFFQFLNIIIALFIHELAHFLTAKKRGFVPDGFCLTPFGASMSFQSGLSDKDEFFVTVSGPAANILSCLFCSALWWFFPTSYHFSLLFFKASFALAVFNLTPVFPFDGGRILLSLSKNKLRFLKVNRIFGFVIASLFLISGVLAAVYGYGPLLIFASAIVFWSCLFEAPKERYRVIFSSHGVFSSPFAPYEIRNVYVDGRAKLGELIKFVSRKGVRYRVVVKLDNKEVLLSQENLEKLFYKNRNLSLSEAISTLF